MSGFGFKTEVNRIVSLIPKGRVMTYGQIAALAGNPQASRQVGGIAHYGDPKLPWHRVVNKQGGLASGYPGGRECHRVNLESEGIKVTNLKVPVEKLIWWPK